MAHLRKRFVTPLLRKQAKLWPVVGLLGPRQSGKTTVFSQELELGPCISLDDLSTRTEAQRSPNTFLERQPSPCVLDEAQKAPEIFDAIKLKVDQKRVPGSYFLTGSSGFSSKIGIHESLTGRIALVNLHPLCLAELHAKEFQASLTPTQKRPRFASGEIAKSLDSGGMPVPAFLRDPEQRKAYWESWIETTLVRDLSRFFKRGYDVDLAYQLLERMGSILREGELPSLKHFATPARKLRDLFGVMEETFLLRRIRCHELGAGTDVWLPFDSGFAAHLMKSTRGQGALLSLARTLIWNEWACQHSYQGVRLPRVYIKSAKGAPVDWIDTQGIPYRIVESADLVGKSGWEERALAAAMKKLGAKTGYLVAPVDAPILPGKKGGIGILPWSAWS